MWAVTTKQALSLFALVTKHSSVLWIQYTVSEYFILKLIYSQVAVQGWLYQCSLLELNKTFEWQSITSCFLHLPQLEVCICVNGS